MVRLDRSLRRISRQFEENVYTTLKVGPRGRMTDAQLYKRYWFLFFGVSKVFLFKNDKKKQPHNFDNFWSKMTKKQNHDIDNFGSKIGIFWHFNNFWTVHVGSFLTKMDNLRRRKCSKFWFDESKCRHIMKHDMLWMRWLNLLCFGLYIQTGFIMIRIALVSNTYKYFFSNSSELRISLECPKIS